MKRNQSQTGSPRKTGPQPVPAAGLPAPAVSYVAGVIAGSLLAVGLTLLFSPPQEPGRILLWALAALAGEALIFPTATGRAHINLATSVHLAMILALPPGEVALALLLSRTVAKFILQRQVWYRALFNVAQCTAATLAASGLMVLLADPVPAPLDWPALVTLGPAFLAAAVTYSLLNTFSVSGVVALTTGSTLWRTWRENYGYAAELAGTSALALLAPLMLLCWQMLGWPGLLIFLAPTLFVKITSERYVSLRRAHHEAIACERLAAKGEIASEVGHEINNYLTAVYCQMHLLANNSEAGADEVRQSVRGVLTQLDNIHSLSRGLMDFSQRETSCAPTRLDALIDRTVAFLKPQNRFDGVDIRLDLDPRIGEIRIDPAQVQQVVMNLVLNAANAMAEAGTLQRRLEVRLTLHDLGREVELLVSDSGPGVSPELRQRIFEPGFTTRRNGNGFGLSTSLRIVQNHGGRIRVEESHLGGALFRVTFPLEADTLRQAA